MNRIALVLASLLATAGAFGAGAAEPGPGADGYAIDTAGSTRHLKVGQKGKLVVAIHAKAPWHVDPRAPLSLRLETPPGLVPEKASAGRKDAVDPRAEVPRFELAVTAAAAGAQEARAHLKFFLCRDTICAQQTRTVAFPVAVR
jgi:hypothetical protein